MNSIKSVKLSLLLTNLFVILLVFFTIALPWMVSWYVETRGRSASLPATIMVTCYPCAPFVAAALLSIRKLLKNILKNKIYTENNLLQFKRISACSLIIGIITLIAGRYYLPFYIVGATFAFLSLLVFAITNVFRISSETSTQGIAEANPDTSDNTNDKA